MNILLDQVYVTVISGLILGFLTFIWKWMIIIRGLTDAIKNINQTILSANARIEAHELRTLIVEKRIEVSDQIFSDLAETGVNTKLIADQIQKPPTFPWRSRKHWRMNFSNET